MPTWPSLSHQSWSCYHAFCSTWVLRHPRTCAQPQYVYVSYVCLGANVHEACTRGARRFIGRQSGLNDGLVVSPSESEIGKIVVEVLVVAVPAIAHTQDVRSWGMVLLCVIPCASC